MAQDSRLQHYAYYQPVCARIIPQRCLLLQDYGACAFRTCTFPRAPSRTLASVSHSYSRARSRACFVLHLPAYVPVYPFRTRVRTRFRISPRIRFTPVSHQFVACGSRSHPFPNLLVQAALTPFGIFLHTNYATRNTTFCVLTGGNSKNNALRICSFSFLSIRNKQ